MAIVRSSNKNKKTTNITTFGGNNMQSERLNKVLSDAAKQSTYSLLPNPAKSSVTTGDVGNAGRKITASNNIDAFDSSAYDADFAKVNDASNAYKNHISGSMISDKTRSDLGEKFKTPTEVKRADAWLKEQLEVIQSGKTSYSDQVRDMIKQIKNREEFSYDVDKDPLFQRALASSLNSGQMAMQNTIAQASALTGGYGSSYATSAANQAYNAYIQDAYDNLPQYYQMALDKYNSDGEAMYRMYGMLSSEDEKEYNRNITAYDATYQRRNQLYDEAYTKYRDEMSDAYAMAGLEMQEYSQRSNDLYNAYTIASDMAESKYERDYNKWRDETEMALRMYEEQEANNRFWAEFNQREHQFDTTSKQDAYEFEQTRELENRKLALSEKEAADENAWKQKELDLAYAQMANKGGSGGGSGGGKSGSSGSGKGSGSGSKKGSDTKAKTPTSKMYDEILKIYNSGDMNAYNAKLNAYLNSGYDADALQQHVANFGADWVESYNNYMNGIKIHKDTFNGAGGEDHNDVYKYTSPVNGKTHYRTYDQLKEKFNGMGMPKKYVDNLLNMLKKQSKK